MNRIVTKNKRDTSIPTDVVESIVTDEELVIIMERVHRQVSITITDDKDVVSVFSKGDDR